MKVNLHNQTEEMIKPLQKIIKSIFKHVKEKKSMEVVFVSQDDIKHMNRTYRDIDKPTDVLSFPNEDDDIKSLGDIFISIEQAKKQAIDYGHSFEREIGFLAVHGYLHLKGYDHHTEEEEKIMTTMQEAILKKAKLERRSS
ncbi:MAG: rRNA maturation RNase YbeY [Tenericutes bacterium HGW-Tenericutes-6]|jgi:probable rRNA maturation factor|nr:MAG: rRNA maturation RNase YbeY [Tenericutes bacterium HGW-Tenericutes-6]